MKISKNKSYATFQDLQLCLWNHLYISSIFENVKTLFSRISNFKTLFKDGYMSLKVILKTKENRELLQYGQHPFLLLAVTLVLPGDKCEPISIFRDLVGRFHSSDTKLTRLA
jgi:hypothetical protein